MRVTVFLLLIALTLPAAAADQNDVVYEGGTIPTLHSETAGRLDSTNLESLAFISSATQLNIRYAEIQSYEYSREVVHHLGVLPAIGVGLVRARKKNHFVRIVYRDDNGESQVAVFRIPKHLPNTLMPILQARAPQAPSSCRANAAVGCWEK